MFCATILNGTVKGKGKYKDETLTDHAFCMDISGMDPTCLIRELSHIEWI